MNPHPISRTKQLVVLTCIALLNFACSKDTDLLAEYIVSESLESYYLKNLAIDDSYIVSSNGSATFDVLENDTFENNNVVIVGTSSPQSGTLTINEDQTITYTPTEEIVNQPNVIISDKFTYVTETTNQSDEVESQEATVNISIGFGELKAFPGAEGFGKYSLGGRGGQIVEVTNLNDSGPGSLRAAIDASGPRTVIFKVAGYITLNSPLIVRNDKITIAGQTAPGQGITLRINQNKDIYCLKVKANDVIIRGLRFRPGLTPNNSVSGDALQLTAGNRIMIDHCSFSWSVDELVNPWGASKVTFQDCIFSEALMFATHAYTTDPNSPEYRSPHSMGLLIGEQSNEITIYKSIFAHNNQRSPRIGGGNGLAFEFVNNIYYNWGDFSTVISAGNNKSVNLINNLYIKGQNSNVNRYPILIADDVNVFAKGNINSFRKNNTLPELNALGRHTSPFSNQALESTLRNSPFDLPLAHTEVVEPSTLISEVTNSAGGFAKDDVDIRIISDVTNGTGQLIDNPNQVGGYPSIQSGSAYIDEDRDGIDDSWEELNGLDPNNPNDGAEDLNNDGFTNLEDFLHFLTLK